LAEIAGDDVKVKHAVWLLAAVFAVSITTFLLLRERTGALSSAAAAASSAATAETGSHTKVIVYYFHLTVRCARCRAIEAYSREGIETAFAGDLKSGAIDWRSVDIELPENNRFVQDYQLFTSSLVLVKVRDRKHVEWRNLDKVWDLVRKKGDFLQYVQTNIREYL
jgi:hypothetical protein